MTTPAANTPPPAAPVAPPPAAAAGAPPPPAAKPGGTFLDSTIPPPAESKPGEAKPGEAKPGEPPPAAAKLEVKFPETLKVDESRAKAFTELAGKLGLDSPKAQGLVDFYAEMGAAQEKSGLEAAQAELKSWNEAIVADKDLGGANIEITKKHATDALKKFATPAFRELLSQTGLGSHPEMVRFVVAVGKAGADDTITNGSGGTASDAQSEESFLKNLFPSMYPGK